MNNGMIEYKESFVTKIKNFFKKLFGKKEEPKVIEKVVDEPVVAEENKKDNFINNIKIGSEAVDNVTEKYSLLQRVEGNTEELENLSIEELKKLEKYYDEIIAKNDAEIKRLKAVS